MASLTYTGDDLTLIYKQAGLKYLVPRPCSMEEYFSCAIYKFILTGQLRPNSYSIISYLQETQWLQRYIGELNGTSHSIYYDLVEDIVASFKEDRIKLPLWVLDCYRTIEVSMLRPNALIIKTIQ